MSKIKIELEVFNALELLVFLRAHFPMDQKVKYELTAINEAVDELQDQITKYITDDQWEEVEHVDQTYQMIGKLPRTNKINK